MMSAGPATRFYALVGFLAVAFTAGYTADLGPGWLGMFVLVPTWGLFVGATVAFFAHKRKAFAQSAMLGIVIFSVAFHGGLMIEEASVGLMRSAFDSLLSRMTVSEREGGYVTLDLGDGRHIACSEENPFSLAQKYQLDFEYNGKHEVTEDEISQIGWAWLLKRGYRPEAKPRVDVYPNVYRKGFFSFEVPGGIILTADVANGPMKGPRKLRRVLLKLVWRTSGFDFEEAGWEYTPVNVSGDMV